jgi:tetratricopeptide (TPR) repeat protein
MRRSAWILAALTAVAVTASAQDAANEAFAWSWQEAASNAPAEAAAGKPSAGEGEGFAWSWEGETADIASAEAADEPSIAARDYEELLRENLNLRKQIADVSRSQESIGRENRQLAAEIQQLEQKILELADVKRRLEQRLAAPAAPAAAETAELEAALAEANRENAALNRTLAETQARLAALPPAVPPGMPSPKPGSDLFRELERENATLKQRIVDLDAQRRREIEMLARKMQEEGLAAGQAEQLAGALADARVKEKQQRQVIEKLVRVIPKLEQELDRKNQLLARSKQGMLKLKQELDRREHRVVKAQRMAGMLDRARSDVEQVRDGENRDMLYNLALVYAREGRAREAEQAYLRALQLDPADPDIHYNLGILYDDELKDRTRALMHYRKYLKLSPHAPDQDQVENWILQIETDLTR